MKLNWNHLNSQIRCKCHKGNTLEIMGGWFFVFNIPSLNAKVGIIEASKLTCRANQLTGFFMMATLALS